MLPPVATVCNAVDTALEIKLLAWLVVIPAAFAISAILAIPAIASPPPTKLAIALAVPADTPPPIAPAIAALPTSPPVSAAIPADTPAPIMAAPATVAAVPVKPSSIPIANDAPPVNGARAIDAIVTSAGVICCMVSLKPPPPFGAVAARPASTACWAKSRPCGPVNQYNSFESLFTFSH